MFSVPGILKDNAQKIMFLIKNFGQTIRMKGAFQAIKCSGLGAAAATTADPKPFCDA